MKLKLIFFVLFASMLIMLLHGFIPHHHHTHPISLHKDNACHSEKDDKESDNKHEHKAPFHCHAFNNADWVKQNQDNNSKVIKVVFLAVLNSKVEEQQDQNQVFVKRNYPNSLQTYFSFYTTRPPPYRS